VKLDRELRKEWIKHYTGRHHKEEPLGFFGRRAKLRRQLAASIREHMTAKRARRKTQQQQRRNTK
jgi:hypothetical protein